MFLRSNSYIIDPLHTKLSSPLQEYSLSLLSGRHPPSFFYTFEDEDREKNSQQVRGCQSPCFLLCSRGGPATHCLPLQELLHIICCTKTHRTKVLHEGLVTREMGDSPEQTPGCKCGGEEPLWLQLSRLTGRAKTTSRSQMDTAYYVSLALTLD